MNPIKFSLRVSEKFGIENTKWQTKNSDVAAFCDNWFALEYNYQINTLYKPLISGMAITFKLIAKLSKIMDISGITITSYDASCSVLEIVGPKGGKN